MNKYLHDTAKHVNKGDKLDSGGSQFFSTSLTDDMNDILDGHNLSSCVESINEWTRVESADDDRVVMTTVMTREVVDKELGETMIG